MNKYGFLDLFQNAAEKKKKKKKRKKPTKNTRHKNLKVCFILFDPFSLNFVVVCSLRELVRRCHQVGEFTCCDRKGIARRVKRTVCSTHTHTHIHACILFQLETATLI